jgi:hypothetical protein
MNVNKLKKKERISAALIKLERCVPHPLSSLCTSIFNMYLTEHEFIPNFMTHTKFHHEENA